MYEQVNICESMQNKSLDNGKITDFNSSRKLKSFHSFPYPGSATNNKWLDIIPNLPLKFFIHGWKDYGSNNWVEQLQDGMKMKI